MSSPAPLRVALTLAVTLAIFAGVGAQEPAESVDPAPSADPTSSAAPPSTQVAPEPTATAGTNVGTSPGSSLPAPAIRPTSHSFVYTATDRSGLEAYDSDPEVERQMVDRLILNLTGQEDLGRAWGKLVKPSDRVGIKVATNGSPVSSTHRGVVNAIVRGLELAGVPRSNVVVWDRQGENLRGSGYTEARAGFAVRSIDPPRGFDLEAKFTAPMLGVLIWGDLDFRGRPSPLARTISTPQVSSDSHLARVLSREVTRIINVPTFSDERGCGIAGALYNVTVPNVDNGRRFTQGTGMSSICDLYADPRIGPKVAVTIVDGLLAQFAGGPDFNPNYVVQHRTLYASRDPVAIDATLLPKLEAWRKQANLPPIGERAAWVREAQTIGLGNFEADRITVVPVTPAS